MAPRKKNAPFVEHVVYVVYPSSSKEYAYKCNIPGIVQGSRVVANGTVVSVVRTASHDDRATRYVSDVSVVEREDAIKQLMVELNKIAVREESLIRYGKLKTPHAKKMLNELKSLLKK